MLAIAPFLFDNLSKKEAAKKTKVLNKLNFYLSGIKDMISLPQAIFIIDTKKEQLALQEAKKLGIPIVGVVDTNADPTEVDYPIPGNDDAIRAIKLLCTVMADAVIEGQKKFLSQSPSHMVLAAKTAVEEPASLDMAAAIELDDTDEIVTEKDVTIGV